MSAATPEEQILGIVNNHWQSCCVGAAAQLELADMLADGPLHADILAERTKTHEPVSDSAGSGEHRDFHADSARSIWQHARERLPPTKFTRL